MASGSSWPAVQAVASDPNPPLVHCMPNRSVTAAALGAFDWVRWRRVASAGALTYPLYLIHQEIGFEIITRLSRPLPPYATVAVTLAFMLLAAWLIHRFVERPLAPLIKRGMTSSFAAVRRSASRAEITRRAAA